MDDSKIQIINAPHDFAIGIGLLLGAMVLSYFAWRLAHLLGYKKPKPIIIPRQIIEEDIITGVKKYSEPKVVWEGFQSEKHSDEWYSWMNFFMFASCIGSGILAIVGTYYTVNGYPSYHNVNVQVVEKTVQHELVAPMPSPELVRGLTNLSDQLDRLSGQIRSIRDGEAPKSPKEVKRP
jgi:hypothetical protein